MSNDTAYISIMATLGIVAFATTLKFVLRIIELRHERLRQTPPNTFLELSQRLDRIEKAVETTALEVDPGVVRARGR